jgi:hypothetical protein
MKILMVHTHDIFLTSELWAIRINKLQRNFVSRATMFSWFIFLFTVIVPLKKSKKRIQWLRNNFIFKKQVVDP